MSSPQEWEAAIWIEGTLFVDFTTRTVTWFEEGQDHYLPRFINLLVEQSWPGWTALWSPEGVRGVLSLAGVDPATLFTPKQFTGGEQDHFENLGPGHPSATGGVMSVDFGDGAIFTFEVTSLIHQIAELGPERVGALVAEVMERRRKGEPVAWGQTSTETVPRLGMHLDFGARYLSWWCIGEEYMHLDAFDALWPEWTIETRGDDFEWQGRLTGNKYRSWPDEVGHMLAWIEHAPKMEPRQNPFIRMSGVLDSLGEGATASDNVWDFVPSQMKGDTTSMIELLKQLETAPPIPPAAFVDRTRKISRPT